MQRCAFAFQAIFRRWLSFVVVVTPCAITTDFFFPDFIDLCITEIIEGIHLNSLNGVFPTSLFQRCLSLGTSFFPSIKCFREFGGIERSTVTNVEVEFFVKVECEVLRISPF